MVRIDAYAILKSIMADIPRDELLEEAKKTLKRNSRKNYTVPAADLYPHQWLWDSCFISIGLRHIDVNRAKEEIISLLRGQWSNGMFPNIIFAEGPNHHRERELWRSYLSPYAPDKVATSGITQPPLLAESIVRIGEKLKKTERRTWYNQMYGPLLKYHEWLYRDRDPHNEGLILLLHPYESGLDNTPPWISELRKHSMPWWILAIERFHLEGVINLVRLDTKHVHVNERMSNVDAMAYWSALRRLRRKAYNTEALLSRSLFTVEDLAFNCIFIRANTLLKEIAEFIGKKLPEELLARMEQSEKALEQLWDESQGQYFSRSFVSHKLVEETSVATFLPLYAGIVPEEKVTRLVGLLKNQKWFGTEWPVPSVPVNSPYFDPYKYWQGPTWININWLIIDGLRRHGLNTEAQKLKERTLEMVANSGFAEYFNPLTSEPAGADNFSWTAALTIDFLK